MWKNIGTGGLAQGKILGVLAFYTWVVVVGLPMVERFVFGDYLEQLTKIAMKSTYNRIKLTRLRFEVFSLEKL